MRLAPFALAALLALPVAAQDSPEAAVQATITQLFDGMRAKRILVKIVGIRA